MKIEENSYKIIKLKSPQKEAFLSLDNLEQKLGEKCLY